MSRDAASDQAFVQGQTRLQPCPFVPELRLWTATRLDPIWSASGAWLEEHEASVPFWAFAWPGGLALARAVLDGLVPVAGCSVVDVASGSGLVAIAAARAGASSVVAVDIDPLARAACAVNADANGVRVAVASSLAVAPLSDVVLAGDAFYDPHIRAALLPELMARARSGARVYVGDPGRAHLPRAQLLVRAEYKVPVLMDLESRDHMDVSVLELPAEISLG